ncbi:hypothetical protein GCM10010156_20920 [Planobispora rosea]|nr:hypothetical protein GCM10010156_20920 [Planobispora rosea]
MWFQTTSNGPSTTWAASSPASFSASARTETAAQAVITSLVNRLAAGTAVSPGAKVAARTARGTLVTVP